jgi:hypothetical protein
MVEQPLVSQESEDLLTAGGVDRRTGKAQCVGAVIDEPDFRSSPAAPNPAPPAAEQTADADDRIRFGGDLAVD